MTRIYPQIQSWWLLCMATIITVGIVAASQLFTDRISLLLDRQATELLAADLLINSSEPISDELEAMAAEQGLKTARTVQLRTAVFVNDEPLLVSLKAVSPGYPLRGNLEIKPGLLETPATVPAGPPPGELWVDNKLAGQLGMRLEIGYSSLPVSSILHYEPDRGGSLFNLAPRIMMNLQDLPAAGLLVPGSRARYKLLVSGEQAALQRFEAEVTPRLGDGQRLQNITNARPEMRKALDRTARFFSLSIVMTLVIAMVAIAITARYAASREATRVAVMRTFGISSARLLRYYLAQVLKVWCWALPAGVLLGYFAQYPLQWALGFWFDARLPQATAWPYLMAAAVGLVSLLGFSLPPLLNVIDTPPMQVLRPVRRQSSGRRALLLTMISLLTLFTVLLMVVSEIRLAGLLFLVVLGAAVVVPLLLRGLILLLGRSGKRNFWLKNYLLSRLLVANRNALVVMSGFSLTLLAVLLIFIVKDQLLQDWERQLPEGQPNYFLINIPAAEVEPLQAMLVAGGVPASDAYPMIRARLSEINGVSVRELQTEGERRTHFLTHTFNISHTERLPRDNEIVSGAWLSEVRESPSFSIEQGMAEELGLALDDELSFTVAGETFSAPVSSIRSVEWENFRPNFYVIGIADQLAPMPQTWLLSAYISDQNRSLLRPLVKRFPSITLLDVTEVLQRVKGIVDRASMALEFFFVFSMIAAIIVLLSALNTANRDRSLEIALLQALGASRKAKWYSQLFEFVFMGVMVGLFAALLASLTGYVVARQFFDIEYSLTPTLWIYSIVLAVGLITAVGALFVSRAFSTSPMRLLRS